MARRELKVIQRGQWGAQPARYSYPAQRPAPRIWVHHTVAAFYRSPNWKERLFKKHAKGYVRQIQDFHMRPVSEGGRGWSDIAYTFIVFKSFFRKLWVFEGRGWGVVGAHTAGDNSRSHGIAYAGNTQTERVGTWVARTYARLIKRGIRAGYVTKRPAIDGHSNAQGASTECPGKYLRARIPEIRRRVNG